MENVLTVTAVNTREIYNVIEWLKGCIVKKMARGIEPNFVELAHCATMIGIVRDAKRQHTNCGGAIWWGKDYEREAREEIARYILDEISEEA